MNKILTSLNVITATTAHMTLIMQNFHWHVTGPHFLELHEFFGEGYKHHAEALDELAERIVALGSNAPATLAEIGQHSLLKDPSYNLTAKDMLAKLQEDYKLIITHLKLAIKLAQEEDDEGSADLLIQRLAYYEKYSWMIVAMLSK